MLTIAVASVSSVPGGTPALVLGSLTRDALGSHVALVGPLVTGAHNHGLGVLCRRRKKKLFNKRKAAALTSVNSATLEKGRERFMMCVTLRAPLDQTAKTRKGSGSFNGKHN